MKLKQTPLFIGILAFFAIGCSETEKNYTSQMMQNTEIEPPVPKQVSYEHKMHGDVRPDNYYWMKLSDAQKAAENPDAQTQDVLDYLNAENSYTTKMTAHLDGFKDKLFDEIVGRIKQTDMSVPYFKNGYYYLTRYEEGKEYPIYTRKEKSLEADELMLLDVNELATDYEFYTARGLSVSPDNKLLAYGEDTLSRRIYTIKFKNLETGEMLDDVIENTTGSIVWANDNKTLFYTRKDAALRAFKIYRHTLGTPSSDDVEIYHEEDETFSCYVYKTKSEDYIIIGSFATVSNEFRYLDANNPEGDFSLFQNRERDLEHNISHFGDKWYIVTNKDGARNFKVMTTGLNNTSKENWVDFIPHKDDVFVDGIDMFKNFMVINERKNGLTKIKVMPWENPEEPHYIGFDEESYMAYSSTNPEFDTDIVRVYYTSLTTPGTTYDYDMVNKTLDLKKQQEVIGDFDPKNYTSERVMIKARDGVEVPVSIVYRNGFKKDGSQPLLLYGYGSYGASMDPYFSSVRLSLLDRGFAYAIAHIRGGQEMGRQWYDDGKLLKKKNTFTDFVDAGQYLVDNDYTNSDKLFAMGGSAGGLLMGAVVNMAPDLWKGIIAAVPFVDVVSTMLDESIPLTTGEYDEWGNPNDPKYYEYIKSYSPYDNVEAKDYPSMLVTTGYHDSQVQYWEPAKWVAKLRELKTDNNPLLLHTDMGAGHGGKSGRFERYKETALEYAFLLDLAGKAEVDLID
ncbi:MAG: S9 family peptidase [Saprospiraceae bacterium]|nr:S9 family peptidase [Saprospiraceae bacterium]